MVNMINRTKLRRNRAIGSLCYFMAFTSLVGFYFPWVILFSALGMVIMWWEESWLKKMLV